MRGRSVPYRYPLLLALLLLAPPALYAMEHPNQEGGLSAPGLHGSDIDSISAYNGGLSLSIPVGPLFTLVYNSHVWTYEDRAPFGIEALAHPRSNAGLGWVLSLGRVYKYNYWPNNENHWVYEGPDGSTHTFFDSLHIGEEPNPGQNTLTGPQYTRDGSYLRMTGSDLVRTIEFPDGSEHTFTKKLWGWYYVWLPTRLEDAFGNYHDIAYNSDATLWTITDRHGRTHYVRSDTGQLNLQVTEIDYETVGGQRAVYSLTYWEQHRWRSAKDTYPFNNDRILVPLLTQITYPDGSSYRMLDSAGQPHYYDTWGTGDPEDIPGVLAGIELPTKGKIEWDFQEFEFPTSSYPYIDTGAGVETRTLLTRNGTIEGIWTYSQKLLPVGQTPQDRTRTDVVSPDGSCTRSFFYADPVVTTAGWRGWQMGLPFDETQSDGGRFLSQEVWTSNTSGTWCAGTKLRSTYVQYEHDELPSTAHASVLDQWSNNNQRLVGQRVRFHDDGDRYIDTSYEDFDGLGHYRKATVTGDLRPSDTRVTTTSFNPARGTYEFNQTNNTPTGNHNYVPVPETDPWVMALYDSIEVSEPGATYETEARVEFDFDPANGFLKAQRVLASGTSRGANDILVVFEPGSYGELLSETTYGGDLQALSTGPGWTPPATWGYRVEHTYQYGVRKTSQVKKPDGTYFPFFSYDVDLDASTGRVLTSRDPSGVETDYVYDLMGRAVEVVPEAGAKSVATLTHATGSQPFQYAVAQKTAGGTVLSQQETWYDDFGRSWKERRFLPDHGWVERETLYDAMSRRASVSAWGDFTKKTEYLGYDAFGRPATIRPPEGSSHDQTFTYQGERQVYHYSKVATSASSEESVASITRRDSFGRLYQVLQKPFADATWMSATYYHDVGNRLARIYRNEPKLSVAQNRYFEYDNRGLLLRERHPEKGALGNNWVDYSEYDVHGNAGRVLDGSSDLGYEYDAMGRLTRVEDRNQGDRVLKEFVYDGGAGSGEGKLKSATRHNYVTLPWVGSEQDLWVKNTFAYNAPGGRLSRLWTRFVSSLYYQDQTYNDLGQVETLDYPECSASTVCPQVPAPSRTLTHTFDSGALRSVSGWTGNLAVHPSGSLAELPHANTVSDETDVDGVSPDRLGRSYTTGATPAGSNWDSGAVSYDGSGNIKAIGAETYVYDKVSRIASGTAAGDTQSYTYDGFCNLTAITHTPAGGSPQTRTISTVASTNRLSMAAYDDRGNVTGWAGNSYTYDALGSMSQMNGGQWTYLYNAKDERVAVLTNDSPQSERYAIRGPGGRVMRELEVTGAYTSANLSWVQDYVYAGGRLIGSDSAANGVRHYHRDHLGSLRLVTDGTGQIVGEHTYLPYGEEVSGSTADGEAYRYTVHARDENYSGTDDDLDYMMARYYSPHLGRFLQVDELKGKAEDPQTLNRYAYVKGGPLVLLDPDGKNPRFFSRIDVMGERENEPFSRGGIDYSWIQPPWSREFWFSPSSGGGGGGHVTDETLYLRSGCGLAMVGATVKNRNWRRGWARVTTGPNRRQILDLFARLLSLSAPMGPDGTRQWGREYSGYAYYDQNTGEFGLTQTEGRTGSHSPIPNPEEGQIVLFDYHTHESNWFPTPGADTNLPWDGFILTDRGVTLWVPGGRWVGLDELVTAPWSYFGRDPWGLVPESGRKNCF